MRLSTAFTLLAGLVPGLLASPAVAATGAFPPGACEKINHYLPYLEHYKTGQDAHSAEAVEVRAAMLAYVQALRASGQCPYDAPGTYERLLGELAPALVYDHKTCRIMSYYMLFVLHYNHREDEHPIEAVRVFRAVKAYRDAMVKAGDCDGQ